MKIYAIDNKNEEYDEWKDYVTEYKPEMIPNLEQKQWPTTEEYLANQDRINEYVKTNYGQEVINQVLDLYRKLTPISHIGKKLGIDTDYIRSILITNMESNERKDIKSKIRSRVARIYQNYGHEPRPIDEIKRIPLLVWQSYYVQKKGFEQTAKDLKITYEHLARILKSIQGSLSPRIKDF